MIVRALKLENFRSHSGFEVSFNPGATVITGANGSGKTSILEAVYLGLVGTSFRASDKDILKYGADYFRAEVKLDNGRDIKIGFSGGKKFFEIDDKKYGRLPREYRYPVILFQPSDMNIVFSSPSRRRDFFDRAIIQLNDNYRVALSRYERALRQRNELLKNNPSREDIFAWNVLLAKYGTEITSERDKYIGLLNDEIGGVYASIAEKKDEIRVVYDGDGEITESHYLANLDARWDRDLMSGVTNFGPHRDGFEFFFNSRVVEDVASRGEVRSVMLAMKFIEADIIEECVGKKPLILLDDVFSELDEQRQSALMTNFRDYQIVASSVKAPDNIKVDIELV